MTITYRNGFRDWLAFQAYCVPRNPVTILTSVGFFLFATFEVVLPRAHQLPAGVPLAACVFGFIVVELALIAFIMAFLAFITILPMIFPRNKLLYCERKLIIDADAFYTESEYSRSETRWSVVRKLVRTRCYIFMLLRQHHAVVVPRRAFEEGEQWDAFYEKCTVIKNNAA
ncbi:MAG: YcxB family protein [Limisphaerales bacterium]